MIIFLDQQLDAARLKIATALFTVVVLEDETFALLNPEVAPSVYKAHFRGIQSCGRVEVSPGATLLAKLGSPGMRVCGQAALPRSWFKDLRSIAGLAPLLARSDLTSNELSS